MKTLREMIDIVEAAQSQGVAEGSEEKDPVWNKGTPMPKDYTCHCGLYVHPSRRNPKAIHTSDCPYAKKQDKEQGVAEGVTPASISKVLRLIQRHHSDWFDTYGIGEVEDTVVDMAEMGQFYGMSAEDAVEMVGQELESMYGQQDVAEEQMDESTPDAMAKIDNLFRK